MNAAPELTMEELRARISAAGVNIAEHRLAMVRKLLGEALVPVRQLDSRTLKTLSRPLRSRR
jgi:hypothetical protein